jgi:hypothetical protein
MSFILAVLSYLRKIALCFWIGEMLFFVTIFAPRVFKILPRELAGNLQGSIFPAYYTAGLVCGVVVLVSLVATQTFGTRSLNSRSDTSLGGEMFIAPGVGTKQLSRRRFRVVMGLTLFTMAVYAFSLWHITPELEQIRPLLYGNTPSPEAAEQFQLLHRLSVQMNAAGLLALLALIFLI